MTSSSSDTTTTTNTSSHFNNNTSPLPPLNDAASPTSANHHIVAFSMRHLFLESDVDATKKPFPQSLSQQHPLHFLFGDCHGNVHRSYFINKLKFLQREYFTTAAAAGTSRLQQEMNTTGGTEQQFAHTSDFAKFTHVTTPFQKLEQFRMHFMAYHRVPAAAATDSPHLGRHSTKLQAIRRIERILQNVPKYNLLDMDDSMQSATDFNYDLHAEPGDERFEPGGGIVNVKRSTAFYREWFQTGNSDYGARIATSNTNPGFGDTQNMSDAPLLQVFRSNYYTDATTKQVHSPSPPSDQESTTFSNWNQFSKDEPSVTIGQPAQSTSRLNPALFHQLMHELARVDRQIIERQDTYTRRHSLHFSDESLSDFMSISPKNLALYKYMYFLCLRELDFQLFFSQDDELEWKTCYLDQSQKPEQHGHFSVPLGEDTVAYLSRLYYLPWKEYHSEHDMNRIIFPWVRHRSEIRNFPLISQYRDQYLNHQRKQKALLDSRRGMDLLETPNKLSSHSLKQILLSSTSAQTKVKLRKEFYFKQQLLFLGLKRHVFEYYRQQLQKQREKSQTILSLNSKTVHRMQALVFQLKLLGLHNHIKRYHNSDETTG